MVKIISLLSSQSKQPEKMKRRGENFFFFSCDMFRSEKQFRYYTFNVTLLIVNYASGYYILIGLEYAI